MYEVITFVEFMKEVSFIFDIYIPNPEVHVKYSKTIKVVLILQSTKKYHQEQSM